MLKKIKLFLTASFLFLFLVVCPAGWKPGSETVSHVDFVVLKGLARAKMCASFNVICSYIQTVLIPEMKVSWLGTNHAADIPWAGGRADKVEKS